MPALDIFGSSAFTMVALTDAINKMPYVPGRIGQLGLFREQGISTTSVMIEEREGSVTGARLTEVVVEADSTECRQAQFKGDDLTKEAYPSGPVPQYVVEGG